MDNKELVILAGRKASGSGGGGGSVTVDTELSIESTNPVQNRAISDAFLRANGAIEEKQNKETIVGVSGSTPTINPLDNTTYKCGELTSLTVTSPPVGGKFAIWFTSGATATVVTGIDNFTPEANKVYRITVDDGYATYDSWSVGGGT